MFKTLLEVGNISDHGGTWEKQLRETIWQQYEDGLERNSEVVKAIGKLLS